MAFYDDLNDHTSFVSSFSSNPRGDFGVYARGYTWAAETLAKSLIESSGFPDYKAYPVVFLFRHALELYLKNVIYSVARVAAFREMGGLDTRLQNCHRLDILSDKANSLMLTIFPQSSDLASVLDHICEVARELSEIDPESFSYRYPIDTKGRPSTKRHQSANLRSIVRHMSEVLDVLDTIDFGLDVEASVAQEIYEHLHSL